jgi:hypothetical protein
MMMTLNLNLNFAKYPLKVSSSRFCWGVYRLFLIVLVKCDNDGIFNLDSSYPKILNGYVTREDYSDHLVKINSQLKRLERYRYLRFALPVLIIILLVATLAGSVFWRIYLDMPGWTFIPVELIIPYVCVFGVVNPPGSKDKNQLEYF